MKGLGHGSSGRGAIWQVQGQIQTSIPLKEKTI
jgi:hypothetical protein